MSSAFTGSFSSTVPPGKSTMNFLLFFTALARASITSLRRKSDSWHAHQVYNFKRNAFQVSTFMITFVVSFSIGTFFWFSSVQLLRCVQLFATPWTNCSTPGFPVHHQLLKLAQTHVHWVGDAIQPSCSLSSPSPPAFNLSQHQGLFKWVSSSHQVAKVLEFQFWLIALWL